MDAVRHAVGQDKQGNPYYICTLSDSSGSLKANILTLGATIQGLFTPGRSGELADVVLGQDTVECYLANPSCSGSVMGRFANRIGGASFTLHGKKYELDANDRGNCLHGGRGNYAGRNFLIAEQTSDRVKLRLLDEGEGGFPGQVDFAVEYRVVPEGALEICYTATATQDTPFNVTNHCYFNLGGHDHPNALDHEIMIAADYYTVLDENCLPNGEILKTAGTALDFAQPVRLGTRLDQLRESSLWQNGFDHNYVVRGRGYRLAASAYDPESGRYMEVYTDQPGLQFFTGNHLNGKTPCKQNALYPRHGAYCFETQNYPNAIHLSHFPDCVLRAGELWHSKTAFRFSTK